MAKMYGMLPSEIIQRATTYDLMVTDILATYENYEYEKASGKVDYNKVYKEEDLMKLLEKSKK